MSIADMTAFNVLGNLHRASENGGKTVALEVVNCTSIRRDDRRLNGKAFVQQIENIIIVHLAAQVGEAADAAAWQAQLRSLIVRIEFTLRRAIGESNGGELRKRCGERQVR